MQCLLGFQFFFVCAVLCCAIRFISLSVPMIPRTILWCATLLYISRLFDANGGYSFLRNFVRISTKRKSNQISLLSQDNAKTTAELFCEEATDEHIHTRIKYKFMRIHVDFYFCTVFHAF